MSRLPQARDQKFSIFFRFAFFDSFRTDLSGCFGKEKAARRGLLKFNFKTDAGILNYINGREFTVATEKIYFTKGYI